MLLAACRFNFDTDGMIPLDAPIGPDVPAGSVTEVFGETPNASRTNVTADTYVSNEGASQGDNFGGRTSLSFESTEKRALLQFDLSAIPPGKVVVSARLHLEVDGENSGAMVTMSPILEGWTEGSQSGSPGVANFTQRTATQDWTSAGVQTPGSAGATIITFPAPTTPTIVSVDLPIATIQSWVDAPNANFGVVMAANGGGDVSVASSEATTATSRPELVVTYFP